VLQRLEHLLGIEDLTREQISFILDQAKPFQEFQRHPLKKLATLRGKTVALAFFENSTRTRISFATAAARLGADTMNLQAESSSLKKGESLLDTVRTLEAMRPDGILRRARICRRPPRRSHRQCWRRHPRTSHAGASRRADHSRSQGPPRGLEPHHSRRRAAQPRCPL
jgi:aspartate carbamoyltransferase catalytic subunit